MNINLAKLSGNSNVEVLVKVSSVTIKSIEDNSYKVNQEFEFTKEGNCLGSEYLLSFWMQAPWTLRDDNLEIEDKMQFSNWICNNWGQLLQRQDFPDYVLTWTMDDHPYLVFHNRMLKMLGFKLYGENSGITYWVYSK